MPHKSPARRRSIRSSTRSRSCRRVALSLMFVVILACRANTRSTLPSSAASGWPNAIEAIALEDLGLDVYLNQIEIISSEQMLDAYCSVGMPLMYEHWSFGKRFIHDEERYRKGYQGLAYEIVINSNPCISYCMEENTMAVQTLVMAHAAFGHNHFFKNNYLFRQWTDAEAILDYLEFAKRYIAKSEERHGFEAVEETLDAAHAVMDYGVFRYQRSQKWTLRKQEERERERRVFRDRRRQRDALDTPAETDHEHQVEHHIETVHPELHDQRRTRILKPDEQTEKDIVGERRGGREDADLEIRPGELLDLGQG